MKYCIIVLTVFYSINCYSQKLNPTIKTSLKASVFKDVEAFREGINFAVIEEGTIVEVLDVQSPYILIKYNDIIGLIGYGRVDPSSYNENLEPVVIEYPLEIKLKTDVVFVNEPSKIADRIVVIKRNSKIVLIQKEGDFFKAKYDDQEGYIHESTYLKSRENPIADIYKNSNKKTNLINSYRSGNYVVETYKVGSSYYSVTYKNGKIIDQSTYSTFY